jgi:hypothetical protein
VRRLGMLRVGPWRDSAGRLRISFDEGLVEVPLDHVAGEWLVPGAALVISDAGRSRSAGHALVWDMSDREAVRAVTLRLVGLVGARRAERALERLEHEQEAVVI